MDIDAEITEGRIVIGTTYRTRTECIFEVLERLGDWVRPVPGTLYVIERTTEIKDRGIKLRPPKDSEVIGATVFVASDCELPDLGLRILYRSKPNV